MQTREQYLASQPDPAGLMKRQNPHGITGRWRDQVIGELNEVHGHYRLNRHSDAASAIRTLDDLVGLYVDGLFVGGADLVAGRVTVDTLQALRFGQRDAARDAQIAAYVRTARGR